MSITFPISSFTISSNQQATTPFAVAQAKDDIETCLLVSDSFARKGSVTSNSLKKSANSVTSYITKLRNEVNSFFALDIKRYTYTKAASDLENAQKVAMNEAKSPKATPESLAKAWNTLHKAVLKAQQDTTGMMPLGGC